MDVIEDTLAWIRSVRPAELKAAAEGSGVSFHTLQKIAKGITKDPGVQTLVAVIKWRQGR